MAKRRTNGVDEFGVFSVWVIFAAFFLLVLAIGIYIPTATVVTTINHWREFTAEDIVGLLFINVAIAGCAWGFVLSVITWGVKSLLDRFDNEESTV